MSYTITNNIMYVRDDTGELVPVSMIASDAKEAISAINSTAENAKSEIDSKVNDANAEIEAKTDEQAARIPEVTTLAEDVNELKDDLTDKLDKGGSRKEDLADLSKFKICPDAYKIIDKTINGVNYKAVSQEPITVTQIWSLIDKKYTEVTFRTNYNIQTNKLVLCANENYCIAIQLTSGATRLFTHTADEYASGTTIANAPSIDELIKCKIDGERISAYVVRNGSDLPIFNPEWIDVATKFSAHASKFDFSTNIGIGLCTSNSSRREANMYDAYGTYVIKREYATKQEYDELKAEVDAITRTVPKRVDLVMFMGQSNMAGRGTANEAPTVADGHGFEFKSITDPTKLYPIVEPFGYAENVVGSVNDGTAKTGSMVSAFMNAYYDLTGVPIVGVSCSQGNTSINLWSNPNNGWFIPIHERLDRAVSWLTDNEYIIRHKYIVYCQGETDGDNGMAIDDYKAKFGTMINYWFGQGIEKFFVVRIGNQRDNSALYNDIMQAQTEICQTTENVVLISTRFAEMAGRGEMKDLSHYTQSAYNTVGTEAGTNMAFYVNNHKEPTMWDYESHNLYFSHK